jgi:glycerol kinase
MDVLEAMINDTGTPLGELRVDGGAASNDLLMQIQADLLATSVVRSKLTEATAFGAAFLAGLTSNIWSSPEELYGIHEVDRIFEPQGNQMLISERKEKWALALQRSLGWDKAR